MAGKVVIHPLAGQLFCPTFGVHYKLSPLRDIVPEGSEWQTGEG